MASTTLPRTHRALTVTAPGATAPTLKALPALLPDSVLVKVKAVALNPTDWKHVDWLLKDGASVGSDFAGTIAAVGADAVGSGFAVGDNVAGFMRGGFDEPTNGTFQGFARQIPELLWRVPAGLALEDAAPMGGIALSTAAQALYQFLDLPRPWSPICGARAPVLIWAGSTGVGMFAIQLAAASGLAVATTASPHNHELLLHLGADAVFDYRDESAPAKIREWAAKHGGLRHAFDTISEFGSAKAIAQAFDEHGGKVVRIPFSDDPAELEGIPASVKNIPIMIYSVLKKENAADFAFISEWNRKLPALIEEGKIKPVPRKHIEGGLDAIPKGLEYMKAGKVSGQKITFTIAE